MSSRPGLRALSARLGIQDGYRSALAGRWVETPDATREALAAALGHDVSTDAAAERACAALGPAPSPAPAGAGTCCVGLDEKLGAPGRRVFGLWTNLYSIRSSRNWGFGHLGDLRELVRLAAAEGAAFVGVNPLHALANRPGRVSPYTPVSRLFRNPLYLDPEAVPGWETCSDARRALAAPELSGRIDALRRADRLDPAASLDLLERVLVPLHERFVPTPAYRGYLEEQGAALTDFATFCALAAHFEERGGENGDGPLGADFRSWPPAFRDARSPAVREFREAHRALVERHAWVQFELDRQLGEAAADARRAGLTIGLYTDLALGSDAGGSDLWAFPGLFVRGVRLGAPPDAFAPEGQDWALPPLDPHALEATEYDFWIRLLRAGLRHAGALRIDHAMGLERLFWIPEGRPPAEGAYVTYPGAELFEHVARESRAHGALMIGEDLGTVPPGFSDRLAARGILSSRVLLFEREDDGFRPAGAYPRSCLATANTHDLPSLAAVTDAAAGERDLALRRRAGQLPSDAALEAARAERAALRIDLEARLRDDGLLVGPADPEALVIAITRFLGDTPAALVGLSLDDLAWEIEPVNLPGVPPGRHESWVRRMRLPLEELATHPGAKAQLAAVPAERRERLSPLPR